jgi:3',5'-cyclic AMP phosphodiesterase CpdA
MRTLIHLSDLHFGRTDDVLLEPLAAIVRELAPDLIAVSGDLTQRARAVEFRAAREFLDRLPGPQVIVPGNHDVPLYNVFKRFVQPLDAYRKYVSGDLEPFYLDAQIAVLGINTARSLTFKHGRINESQIASAQKRLSLLPEQIIKVIVTHHPFDLPAGHESRGLVGRGELALKMLTVCKCDLLLAGHLHVADVGGSAIRNLDQDYEAIIVQAGTATSTRARGETNSFNVIRIEQDRIDVWHYAWEPARSAFSATEREQFKRAATGWKNMSAEN